MFLPWSLISRATKKKDSSRKAVRPESDKKPSASTRRSKVQVETLEDRTLMATYVVDATFTGVSTGTSVQPFKTIQDALNKAADTATSPGADTIYVYGNNEDANSTTPHVYVWGRDTDSNTDGVLDGNMVVGSLNSATETVKLVFRANLRSTANVDGSGGSAANLIVKMQDNIVDVLNGSALRVEGNNNGSRVIFTSLVDDVGGDTNGDGQANQPDRANWGGIRYRAGAVDQDATPAGTNGSFINWADIRYTGQTIFDTVLGAPTEFGSVRMEADATNKNNVVAAQVRVWNTIFQHGGRALDLNLNSLGRGFNSTLDPTNVVTGPDLGSANAQPLTFTDNSINGAFVFVPFEPFTGFVLQQYVNVRLDDVGVPYAATSRWILANNLTTAGLSSPAGGITLTVDSAMIMKFQNTALDASDKSDLRDRTWGTVSVNGTVDRPVVFTSLTDDLEDFFATHPIMAAQYSNGTDDTNNDGDDSLAQPGDWGGLRVGQGNIDHALFRFGGGLVNVAGVFTNYSPIEIFSRDLTPFGFAIQKLRVANSEVVDTFSGILDGTLYDSPAINLISRDWGDGRFAPPATLQRAGDVAVMDNYVHDNQGKAIEIHPLYFNDNENSLGGYGAFFRRNVLEGNANNSLYIDFVLDQARGIDRNLPRGGGYLDDTDIVHNYRGQALIVHTDQVIQLQSRRGVVPAGGYYDYFSNETLFKNALTLVLPGINPIPLQQGPAAVNADLRDHGMFYYNTNFTTNARQQAVNTVSGPVLQRGEEWRDWGVNFQTANGGSDPLFPVQVVNGGAVGNYITASNTVNNGTFDMVFPNAVSAVGFLLVGNPVTTAGKRVEFYTFNPTSKQDELIESMPMPASGVNGVYIGRVSKQPIHIVRFVDEAGDGNSVGVTNLTWVDAPESLVMKADDAQSRITAGGVQNGYANATIGGANGIITDGFTPAATSATFNTVRRLVAPIPVNTIKALNQPSVFTFNVTEDHLISDITVEIGAALGASATNLDITLTTPAGTPIKLLRTGQATGNTFNVTFDDRAPNFIGNTANATRTVTSDFHTIHTQTTPFGLTAPKGTNVRGTWTLTILNAASNAGALNLFAINVRQIQGHQGGTLRVIGQGGYPVVFTGIDDDTIGAGPVQFVQKDNGSNGPTFAAQGSWEGIQIMQGANSNASQRQTQAANGSILQRYNDFNPYTIGDEQLVYNTGTSVVPVPATGALSVLDQMDMMGISSITATPAFNTTNLAAIQDGTLIERAEIRFARVGIYSQANPEGKLSIEGLELEATEATPNGIFPGTAGSNERMQPLPLFVRTDTTNAEVFQTDTGSYRVQGTLGGTSESQVTDDVDWYELPNPSEAQLIQIHVERGRRGVGLDDKGNQAIGIAVFNIQRRLLWISTRNPASQFATPFGGQDLLVQVTPPDDDFQFTTGAVDYDAKYIAVFPMARIPRADVSTNAAPPGLLPDSTFPIFSDSQQSWTGIPPYAASSNGIFIQGWVDQDGNPVDHFVGDEMYNPPGLNGAVVGGYEMELRVLSDTSQLQWKNATPRRSDAQILFQNNLITNFQTAAIDLNDYRKTMSNVNLGETHPGQVGRFIRTNLATNSDGSAMQNRELNPVNPQLNAPADFIPGVIVRNNIINRGAGDGIIMTDDQNSNIVVGATNRPNPSIAYQITNNTIEGNAGTAITARSRGGATITNNILANNGGGFNNVDYGDISGVTPPVRTVFSYNIVFNNSNSGSIFNGSNNLSTDPMFVDAPSIDYRLKLASPGVDSAVSDLPDRLRLMRFPQEPTRAPLDDYRGRRRIDNLTKPNVGGGSSPFFDRGALETNELSLRVINANVVTPSSIVTRPVSKLVITFAGRVDLASLINSTTQSIFLRRDTFTGQVIPLDFVGADSTYDSLTDTHVFTIPFANAAVLGDGTYCLTLNGTTKTGQGTVKDVAGQNLDGEFPSPLAPAGANSFPSGNNVPGGDFNFCFMVKTSTLRGLVWDNLNADSDQDAGEAGIPGAQIDLLYAGFDRLFGTVDDETFGPFLSALDGTYNLTNLPAGIFRITVSNVPPGFVINTPPMPRVVELPIGGTLANVNFGYWRDFSNATISGSIFNDLNGNGTRDVGEDNTGLGQPQVFLTSAGPDFIPGNSDDITYSQIVDSLGNYSFTGLPGNFYSITIDTSNVPATFQRTSPNPLPFLISPLTPGSTRTVEFGFQEKQSFVQGLIFRDLNGSGTVDGGETGIGNVTITLLGAGIDGSFGTADDVTFTPQLTDAGGNYNFGPLTQGLYRVNIDYLNSPILNTFFLTTGNVPQVVNVPNGNTTANGTPIGFRPDPFTASIGGRVFIDANNSQSFDAGDSGLDGVNVQMLWAGRDNTFGTSDDQTYNVTTSGGGLYTNTTLPIGNFRVQPTTGIPAGFGLTTPASLPLNVTLTFSSNSFVNGNFGYQPRNSSVTGTVFNDLNGNGSRQAGENAGLANVRVYLDRNTNGVWDSGTEEASVTSSSGAYSFTQLAPVNGLKVRIDESTLSNPSLAPGFVRTTDLGTFDLPANTNATGRDLGAQQRNSNAIAFVFDDLNGDGVFNTGDSPRPDVEVTLSFNGTAPVNFITPQVLTTGPDGRATFGSLPVGSYTMIIAAPAGVTVIGGASRTFSLTGVSGGSSQSFPLQITGGGSPTSGIFYMSYSGVTNVLTNSDGSTLTVTNSDIVRLRVRSASDYDYNVFFRGTDAGLTPGGNEAIDAFTFDRLGALIISTKGAHTVSNGTSLILGLGEDLLKFVPTSNSINGDPTAGTWSSFFKGSRVGLSGAAENVDGVSLVYTGTNISRVLLSTSGNAVTNNSITAAPQDVLSFVPTSQTSFGAATAGTFSKYFTGAAYGMNDPVNENVDALFYVPTTNANQPRLYMSTGGSFAVNGGFTGTNADVLRFNVTAVPPSVAGRGAFAGVHLRATNYGHGGRNVTGYWQGTVPTDADPFNNPPAPGAPAGLRMTSDLASALMSNGSDSETDSFFANSSRTRKTMSWLLAKSLAR